MTQTLPTQYQQFIHKSRYARYIEAESRREDWHETVDRYLAFLLSGVEDKVRPETIAALRESILRADVLPSMRAMMMAGPAAEACNVGVYNCAYTPIDTPRRFAEVLYILMAGTGVGFSVERQEIERLPKVPFGLNDDSLCHWIIDDSIGWAKAYEHLVKCLYAGVIPSFDYSLIRPAGARLKTKGGRASGPEPLKDLFNFTVRKFRRAQGRKLTSLDVHDIVCKIGEVVVVGGVRRSALISLSSLDDADMRGAKSGQWQKGQPQRALANNSAVYRCRPPVGEFMREWLSLYDSKSGERGIFNRDACNMLATRIGRETCDRFGTNPCAEIILRPQQFCNLTEVVLRASDTFEAIQQKVAFATILGTLQARFTKFEFLGPEWTETTEREALLGVSMTGIYDRRAMTDMQLSTLRMNAIDVNAVLAPVLGINPAAAITCVKPSGTVSQLADCASGIHPRHSPFYIRRVRGDIKDPMSLFLMEQGVPFEPCAYQPGSTVVFSFPQKAPDGAATRDSVTPIEHLEKWLHYQMHWCDHKPSITVSVRDDEWPEVGAWVYRNFDWMSGVSFLPHSDHSYEQAPYEEIDQETYERMAAAMPVLDWSKLSDYELEDSTTGTQSLACTASGCELVDIN